MRNKRKALTLVELIMVVLLLGVMAAVAVPRLSFSLPAKYKAESTARKISGSIRKTRQLAIANAATNTIGYRFSMTGLSVSRPPVAMPFLAVRSLPSVSARTITKYSGYTITDLSSSKVVQTETIDSAVSYKGAATFTFGPLGNRTDTGNLTISASGKTCVISVVSATGMVKCTE